jgi:hypothetical protein
MVDHIRSAHFQTIHLRLALRAGELTRAALAVCGDAPFHAALGAHRRAAERVQLGTALGERTGDARARALAVYVAGFSAMQEGRWRSARAFLDGAEQKLRETPAARWERTTAQISSMWCLGYLGELDELARRQSLRLREARDRGDVFAAVNLRLGVPNLAWLCRDDPAGARAAADEAIGEWSQQGFHFQHFFHIMARASAHLYGGEAEAALELLARAWPAMARSLGLRNQLIRATLVALRGGSTLAAAAQGRDSARRLAEAARDARRLEREQARWCDAHALAVRAAIAHLDGDPAGALGGLAAAAAAFEDAEMALHAAAARLHLARLAPRDGAAAARAAEGALAAQQVRSPPRMAALLVPGFDPH